MKINHSDEISQRPLLLHGTNILAVLHLFERGYLPSSQDADLKGRLYFAYTRFCSRSKRLKEIGYTKREAIATAKDYAKFGGRKFLFEYFGYPIQDYVSLAPNKRNYQNVLQEDYSLSKDMARDIVAKVSVFQGVIIEPSEAIFDFDFFNGDDFNSIAFHFPDGLPDFLIKTVFPLGDAERKVLVGGGRKLDELLGI